VIRLEKTTLKKYISKEKRGHFLRIVSSYKIKFQTTLTLFYMCNTKRM